MKTPGARPFSMHWRSSKVAGFFLFAALGLLGLASTGCWGGTFSSGYPSMYGYSVVAASTVPAGIYDYPSYYWNGDYAYLVNNSWYYPSSGGWVVFEQEPYDLYRYRRQYYARYPQYYSYPTYGGYPSYPSYPSGGVQVAPPARRPAAPQVEYGYRAPAPVYREPVQTAPPAYRSPVQTAPRSVVVDPSPPRSPVQAAPPARRDRGPAAPRGGVQSAPPAPRRR